uniref:Spermatogenesis associated 21 n=1 Tax=Jaculus jaculus TaxID=51337 RepID=A0A8C5LBG4_JACJA
IKNRNTQMRLEDKAEAPGDQSRPGLSSTTEKADAEPTIAGVIQVALEDASGMSNWKQPVAPGGSERELRNTEASPKPSSRAAQEGTGELEAGWEQIQPKLDEDLEGFLQPSIETNDQQKGQRSPVMVEDQPPESCQGSKEQDLGRQCTLDSLGQPLPDDTPGESGPPQVALSESGPGAHEDNSQEAVLPPPMVTTEKETTLPFLPPMPGPQIPKAGGKVVEIQPSSRLIPDAFPCPQEKDTDKKKELDQAQKRLPEATAVAVVRSPRNTRPGFMKCLLEVEEQATHHRALKARALMSWRAPRTMTSVHAPGPVSSSTTLQNSTSASAAIPLWARPLVPGSAPALVGTPVPVLPTHNQDLGHRWPEFGSQISERSLCYAKARQESEERSLLKSWEEWPEEHLTLKQEEAFHCYFEVFNGPGEIDAPSLSKVLHIINFPLSAAQVEEALRSADINGDGHVDFRDFLAVMTDSARFFCSVEQNVLLDMSCVNPSTLFFDILSLLVEMLALPETALEEITSYYQKMMKEGFSRTREMELAMAGLRSRKKLLYNLQQMDSLEVPERRVLRIPGRVKQQNYAANLQSPYAQVPCIPLYPRLEKTARRKHGSRSTVDHCTSTGLSPDPFESGPPGSREHASDSKKWLSSVPARTH